MNFYCFFILTLTELIYDSTGLSQGELGKIVNNYSLFFQETIYSLDLWITVSSAIKINFQISWFFKELISLVRLTK